DDSVFSPTADALADVCVSLAAQNPQLVAGKVLHRALRLLAASAPLPAPKEPPPAHGSSPEPAPLREHLVADDFWKAAALLLRVLQALSFENLLSIPLFLPELFHLVVLTFNCGPAAVRTAVHATVINAVHSLYTTGVAGAGEGKLESLRFLLGELAGPRFR